VYIADQQNYRIRKVVVEGSAMISTTAGDGSTSYSGDGGDATSAGLCQPYGTAIDASGIFVMIIFFSYL